MLINLSNHPFSNWEKEQKDDAEKKYGKITDLSFPLIDPTADTKDLRLLAESYFNKCLDFLKEDIKLHEKAVHIMGELTFTFIMVVLLQNRGINCIVSTTERKVIESCNEQKISVFKFIRFRDYPLLSKLQ